MTRFLRYFSVATIAAVFVTHVLATGMQPETSVVIFNEEDGEASINITNTDTIPMLLYTAIEHIPEDIEPLLIVTPPIARVDAGKVQLIRFISQAKEPIKTQRLNRVFFEGFPQTGEGAQVSVTVRQNLPLIFHPKGLIENREPWKLLQWLIVDGKVIAKNDSSYVIRLAQAVNLQPNGEEVVLPRAYILPGESISSSTVVSGTGAESVRFYPATIYGYTVDSYDAPLVMN